MKLGLGLLGKDIAYRFGMSNTLHLHPDISLMDQRYGKIFLIIRFYTRYRNNTSNNAKKV